MQVLQKSPGAMPAPSATRVWRKGRVLWGFSCLGGSVSTDARRGDPGALEPPESASRHVGEAEREMSG